MLSTKQAQFASIVFVSTVTVITPSVAYSQTGVSDLPSSQQAQNKVLTIYSALSLVDATHPSVTAKRQEVLSAQSSRSAAWQQMLPSLSANRSRGETDEDRHLTTATIKQPIFSGGRIFGGIDKADAQIQETESQLSIARRDLMNRTAAVYVEVIKARAKLKVADKNVATHQELLASIDRRVSSEVSPESDRLLTQSRLSQAQSERTQVALSLQVAEDALRELLAGPLPDLLTPKRPDNEAKTLMESLDQALAFSPELRQLTAQEALAKSEITIQRSAVFPSLFVRHDQFSGDRGSLPKNQTYLGIEFVPGAGFSAGAQIEAAERKRLASIDARFAAEKQLRDQIRSIWAERESLKSQVASTLAYVQSAQSVAESFTRQFTIGRKTWLEVLNAKREALLAELNHTEIVWNAVRTSFQLEIQTGRLGVDQITSNAVVLNP